MNIQVSRIKANEAALRSVDKEDQQFLELCSSISEDKVLQNIIVVNLKGDPDFDYLLVDGLHRLTACQCIGREEIPAIVEDYDKEKAMQIQIMTNVHRKDTKPAELSAGLNRIMAFDPTMTEGDMAKKLSRSQSWVAGILKIDKMPDAVKSLVNSGEISLLNSIHLSKIKDENEIMSLLEDAQTKTVQEFAGIISERVKELNKARKEGREPNAAQFVPVARYRKISEMKDLQLNPDFEPILTRANATSPQDGAKAMLDYVLTLDPDSIQIGLDKFNARAEAKAVKAAASKIEAEARKVKKAQEKAEKAQKEAEELVKASEEKGIAPA